MTECNMNTSRATGAKQINRAVCSENCCWQRFLANFAILQTRTETHFPQQFSRIISFEKRHFHGNKHSNKNIAHNNNNKNRMRG